MRLHVDFNEQYHKVRNCLRKLNTRHAKKSSSSWRQKEIAETSAKHQPSHSMHALRLHNRMGTSIMYAKQSLRCTYWNYCLEFVYKMRRFKFPPNGDICLRFKLCHVPDPNLILAFLLEFAREKRIERFALRVSSCPYYFKEFDGKHLRVVLSTAQTSRTFPRFLHDRFKFTRVYPYWSEGFTVAW